MARIRASVRLDPNRSAAQRAFLAERVEVLRDLGTALWVALEEGQVETLLGDPRGAGLVITPVLEADLVELPALAFRPTAEEAEPPAELRAREPEGEDTGDYLVQFAAPPDRAWLDEISELGSSPIHSLPPQAGVFRLTRDQATQVRALPYVSSVGLYHPAYAVSLELAGVEEPFTASSLRNLRVTVQDAERGNVTLHFFESLDPEEQREAVEATGATIVEEAPHGFLVRVPPEKVNDLLRVRGLSAAEPAVVHKLANNHGGVIIGANQVRDLGVVNFLVNLTGVGEIGGMVDTGCDVGTTAPAGAHPPFPGAPAMTQLHADLRTNVRMIRNTANPANPAGTAPDSEPHGTHVAGTICGDGTSSAGSVRGMAPQATLLAFGDLPINFRRPFNFAFQNGARAINNSWGTNFGGLGITGNRYYGYARAVDRWCFIHPDCLILFAAGNDEGDLNGNGVLDARMLSFEAVSKNALTVGAVENLRNDGGWRDSYRAAWPGFWNHAAFNATAGGAAGTYSISDNADQVVLFSARGRVRTSGGAATNRIKPDLCAPGTNVLSLRSQWVAPPPPLPPLPIPAAFWNANDTSMLPAGLSRILYMIESGTSMATPMTTGSALLVRQYYRSRFSQMRRPVLLQGVPIPNAAPFPTFAGLPSLALHPDGVVLAWVRPALPAGAKEIVAMRLTRSLASVDAAPVMLHPGVGDHSAPKVVTLAEKTYLLHRRGDSTMRLSCFQRGLTAKEAGFGTAGVVTLQSAPRLDDAVSPDLLAVGTQLAVAFPSSAGSGFLFQRFRADNGNKVDDQPIAIGDLAATGPHACLAHGGTTYVVCGVVHPGNYRLLAYRIGDDGQPVAGGPVTLVDQAEEIGEPCIAWNARLNRFAVAWTDARAVPGPGIYVQFLDATGAAVGAAARAAELPAGSHGRRPRILQHPTQGHVLVWEEDSQNGHYDVYLALLDDAGAVDGRLPAAAFDPLARKLVRISDTPEDTRGFAALADADFLTLAFQSPDEINSDQLGIYAVNLTPAGAFAAQEDPSTPMLRSGRYVAVEAVRFNSHTLDIVAAAWAGGALYVLRSEPRAPDALVWARVNADGRPDAGYVRSVPIPFLSMGAELVWGETTLISAVNDNLNGITIYRWDAQGAPVAGFGVGGAAALVDTVPVEDRHTPQIGWSPVTGRVVVGYLTTQAGVIHIRYQRLDGAGARVGGAPVNLAQADGVAKHGWFHFVRSAARSIAIYHRTDAGVTRVHCRLFNANGVATHSERHLSAAAGEGRNGVVAARPTAVGSNAREYAAAWQYRAAAGAQWEIHFCRMDAASAPMNNPPAGQPAQPVRDVAVIAASPPDWPADRSAIEPQLVCTYAHSPWAIQPPPAQFLHLPEWSPSYGLGFIGVGPDGNRILYFTVLDENGRRAPVPQPPPVGPGALAAPVPAPIVQVSAPGVDVRDFKIVWNGCVFLLVWNEDSGGTIAYRYTAINRHANQLAYDIPSAALLRATLVGGATNINDTRLPNADNGYGWGRLNLRQSLSPAPPVTLHVRDDCALGPGRSVTYRFNLPSGTRLLRVTMSWMDPPGPRVVNPLHLTVRTPVGNEHRGNLWDPAAGRNHLSRIVNPALPADAHENDHPIKQVVLENPPPGDYEVEVSADPFPHDAFNQQNLQPFALIFAGSGEEVPFLDPRNPAHPAGIY